jgi:hypothetical protein
MQDISSSIQPVRLSLIRNSFSGVGVGASEPVSN